MQVLKTETRLVPLKQLVMDPKCQMRQEISWIAVQEYADAKEAGDVFPPPVVFWKAGGKYYVADGFHRVHADQKIKTKEVMCEIHHGGLREAMLYSAGANLQHGVRRTNADKYKAVLTLLMDKEWQKWANTEIARKCGVGEKLIARIRDKLTEEGKILERGYRIQFNGRGEIQYRKVEPKKEKKPDNFCPYCGRPMEIETA